MASKCIDNEANCSHNIKHMTEQYQMSQHIEVFTCNDVDAAPINSPSDCATSDVSVPKARKSMKRTASGG